MIVDRIIFTMEYSVFYMYNVSKNFVEQYIINELIVGGQFLGTELLSVLLLVCLYSIIILLWRLYKRDGLLLYNAVAVIIANIQVLKHSSFIFSNEPMALGTILFATTFVVNDILTEHFGMEVARLSIKLSIVAQLITTILMMFTLAYPSSGDFKGQGNHSEIVDYVQFSLYTLFAPSMRILFSSLVAYYISQLIDIKIFQLLKEYTNNKFAWVRLNLSTIISGLMDNILFSTLAWVVLSPKPVSFRTLVITYIFGTYLGRVIVSLTSTPLIYLTYKLK